MREEQHHITNLKNSVNFSSEWIYMQFLVYFIIELEYIDKFDEYDQSQKFRTTIRKYIA